MVELKYRRIPAYSVAPKGRFNQYDWTGSSYGCTKLSIAKWLGLTVMNCHFKQNSLVYISPQVPSVIAWKKAWDLILHYDNPDFDPVFVQATTSQLESEVSDLKNRLEAQETETQRANSKFEFSVSEQEKLKKGFEVEKKAWADEKISLTNRAEKAEAALAEATIELSGLKRHISQMVSAIFGKSPCKC